MKRVREKMRDVERRMETVSKHLPDHYEEFAELDIKRDGIYKNVEIAIQSCYDIAVMIVKEERLAVPEDEASIPLLLAEAGHFNRTGRNTAGYEGVSKRVSPSLWPDRRRGGVQHNSGRA